MYKDEHLARVAKIRGVLLTVDKAVLFMNIARNVIEEENMRY